MRQRLLSIILGGLLVLAWLAPPPSQAHPGDAPPFTVAVQFVAEGLPQPTDIAHAGDDRFFVTSRSGVIRIVQNGSVLPTPFLDLSAKVCADDYQAGLLGIVFHPQYAQNGYFFVNYTAPRAGFTDCDTLGSMESHVSRFSVSANPNVADSTSERLVLRQEQPVGDNNGGDLAFGPDGMLYIPFGDGGSQGPPDPTNAAQRLDTWLGKILRIAPSADPAPAAPYTVPLDNPFVGQPNALPEIWARGLRNPWRISFDRLTGDLFIGDVGGHAREEIDFQPATSAGGENYGWRCYEGTIPTPGVEPPCVLPDHVPPVAEYPHPPGIAVTGGYRYRGNAFPEMVGHYLFVDFAIGKFWSLDWQGGWVLHELPDLVPPVSVSTFGEGPDGELYLADYGGGRLYRVVVATQLHLPLVHR